VSPAIIKWAKNKLATDRDFIEREAKQGNPLIKAIAALILDYANKQNEKESPTAEYL
jgi:hypothetical protein